ncbi:glycosyltransferase family 2 protein [Methylobacterium sp. sgz302541]|uniref:glycosyltransferase family 2 protein n=1 Tax=unclassified Methylobacterium TaxID=2615210 RepID=UPI003D3257BF
MSFLRSRLAWTDAVALPPEIAFLLAEGVPPALLARAATLARDAGTDAATALLRAGLMDEDAYYRALARRLGVPFLDGAIALGPGIAFPETPLAGLAPLAPGGPAPRVMAPEGRDVAELLSLRLPRSWRPALTTPRRLREAVFAAIPQAVAAHASDDLEIRRPDWAFRPGPGAIHVGLAVLLVLAAGCAATLLPAALAVLLAVAVQSAFLVMAVFRIGALFVAAPVESAEEHPPLPDRELPVYTVLVALHREAEVVPRLVRALAALDYPVAKLDIKFVIEADDSETAAALARVPLPARFEVVVAPPGLPRTKPRALNVALPLARGSCLVVYDAEDVPDPGQLRRAAGIFSRAPATTACLQGRLVIDNASDSWLTRCFVLEYAALFDVLGPALAHWHLPTPLGGTSTHFRTQVLRQMCGWDAHNVTEDADLGMRLALAGYDVGDLPSATIEEAPARLGPWLRQRTRWMKGFVQTSLTHGRRPLRTLRALGPLDALCALAMLPGTVISALVYPLFTLLAVRDFLWREIPAGPAFWPNLPVALSLTLFGIGFLAMLAPAALGCFRRDWRDLIWIVPTLPAYFLLVSLAAWLGVIELVTAPTRWNKTQHGLARSSRSGALKPGPAVRAVSPAPPRWSRPAG